MEDRVCHGQLKEAKEKGTNTDSVKRVQLSAQEMLDCDQVNDGCKGGNVNKVLTWGKRKGFITEQCYPTTGLQG